MTTSAGDDLRAQEEEQQRQLGVLQGIADHAVARVADGRLRWDVWLEQASRHGRYGFTNTLLIPAQRPTASDVRSYDAWQKQGRQVRRGETGIRIISTRGKPRTVFDIAQTDGHTIERPELTPAEGLRRLSQLAADLDFYVDRGQGWTYLGRPGRRIKVAPELDDTIAATVLAHQLAHALRPGGRIDPVSDYSASCHGVRRVLADSVAYIVLAELGLDISRLSFPPSQRWAGKDARTDSFAAIRAVGDQIVRTSTRLKRRLHDLSETAPPTAAPRETAKPDRSQMSSPPAESPQQASAGSTSELHAALADTHRFYRRNLQGSWGTRYLAGRGFTSAMQEQWEIGFAPRAWRSLLRHLRELGHSDQTLIEAGLAKQKDGGEPFDLFRDRVVFPLRDRGGEVIGFIGRRRDDAQGPKYLNTPETALFHKGDVLFGLHEGLPQFARTARPLLVEGPLDAIAVNVAMPDLYAAVAPCGTAITAEQIKGIGVHTDLEASGLVIALDGDPAGRVGAVRAWRTLHRITGPVEAAVLPQGQDPAELLSPTSHSGVREALLCVTPLADLVVDESIQRSGGALEFVESRLAAAQAAAALIAELPPDQIARQVTRVAVRTGVDPTDVTTFVASAISPDPSADAWSPQLPSPDRQNTERRNPSHPASPKRTNRRTT
ncbi:toprim domain-containing protein [Actinomadura sp. 7K507]|uniref:toprim domain-containing protein n=1 Tax=Actinomadura sp. 7K507 TaxID=2530365 RepID=UPI00104EADAB|nr:toprim domain-containing protein [Actinomadura sp. 7K507]TDC91976.1 toprim domain-containing protein [Actinomadura sp. 7K507]